MIKSIVRDQFFLQQKSEPATEADKQKLLDAQAAMREFIKDTGRTRRYDREQIVTDKEQRNKSNTVKTPKLSEQSTNKSFKNLIKGAKNRKIEYLEVKDSGEIPSTLEAYKRLAGSDMTKGSCVSVALAYIGQRSGWDVRDFRGGESQEYFSLNGNNRELKRLTGVKAIEVDGISSIEAGKELLGKLTDTKEYLIMVGRHASIVRRNTAGDMMYLEMQSKAQRGWHTMYSEEQTLRDRFGCNDDVDPFWKKDGFAIATEQLTGSQELKEILGYINTESGKEEIGSGGSIK